MTASPTSSLDAPEGPAGRQHGVPPQDLPRALVVLLTLGAVVLALSVARLVAALPTRS